jgi:leucyl-tRNA synthetase
VFRFFTEGENISQGNEEDPEILKKLHQTIRKVETDIENLRFNTAISAMMIFLNLATKKGRVSSETAAIFAKILSPFAPHIGEELWSLLGNSESIACQPWPEVNEEYLKEEVFEYPVSFNGKLRFRIELPLSMDREEIIERVVSDERAKKWLETGKLANVIVVPNRIVNVVVKN